MIYIKKVFDSYRLNRMITEFSWDKSVNESYQPVSNDRMDYVRQNYKDIFLKPEFVINKADTSSSTIGFTEIDILEIYNDFTKSFANKLKEGSIHTATNPTPKSMDYVDGRLFATPENILQHILNEKRLSDKCMIHLGSDCLLFDSNFEQLTLIMGILERTFEYNPLHKTEDEFNYSSMIIVPKFTTHSFIFSFNLTKGIPHAFGELDALDIFSTLLLSSNRERTTKVEFSPLSGYDGIYISLQQDDNEDIIILFHVSNEFTKSGMLFDNTTIQKTSLLLLDYVLKELIAEDFVKFKNLKKLRTEIKVYIT